MCIESLMKKVQARTYTPEERSEMLVEAKILDEAGNYHKDYFTSETIRNNRSKPTKAK